MSQHVIKENHKQKTTIKRIYVDHAAATPLDPVVLKKMMPYFTKQYGNPSSIHAEGRAARAVVENARRAVADVLGVRRQEIIFTGSGTESIALALRGVLSAYPGSHLITSVLEHPAVEKNAKLLSEEGYAVSFVGASAAGIVDTKRLAASITPQTTLVSIIYVNNEIGSVQPIKEVARVVRRERNRRRAVREQLPLWFHIDASQAPAYHPLRVDTLGVDLMTLNASKIYGPKGIGLLYKRSAVSLQALWEGGGQEGGMRSGTEHVAGIVGFAAALGQLIRMQSKECARMKQLQAYFLSRLQGMIPAAVLNGPPAGNIRTPNNVHVSIPGIAAESLVLYLDAKGVSASTGSACSAHSNEVSRGILHILQKSYANDGGVRFTMGRGTTKRDVDYVVGTLRKCVDILKRAPTLGRIEKNVIWH